MKTLYINGCSHTAGTLTSLDGDLTKAWPNLLKDSYNVVDDSWVGCSNDRIFRTTIERCVYDTPDIAIIQFTYPNRFESPSDSGIMQHLPEQGRDEFYSLYWNKETHERSIMLMMLPKIVALQHFFESLDIEYGFIIWPNMSELEFNPLWRSIDKDKVINSGCMDTLLHSWEFNLTNKPHLEYPEVLDRHYDYKAHKFIADGVRDYIINKEHLVSKDTNTIPPQVNLIYV